MTAPARARLAGADEHGFIPEDRIRELLERAPVSGGAIAISAPGIEITLPFGTRGPGGSPVSADDRFEIGSISKTVAALAAARLEEERTWSLDESVCEILPWLQLPSGAGLPTLRHLLSHTAGWIAGNDALPGDTGQALQLPLTVAGTAPGEFFHYSNIGYVVFGLALAARAGETFPAAEQGLILDPLGIPCAIADITGAARFALVPGTAPLRDDAPWRPGDALAVAAWAEPAGADGNIGATAPELARFGRALADPEAFGSDLPWLAGAVARIATPSAPEGEDILTAGPGLSVSAARYGLGVNVEDTADGTLLTHGGGMIGYGAFLIAQPSRRLSVAVVLSAPGERAYGELLAREVHAAVLSSGAVGAAPDPTAFQPGSADPVAALMPERPPLVPGEGLAASISGTYRGYSPWFPHFEVGVSRDGGGEGAADRIVLRAYAGVEAPTEDVELVPLDETWRRFRIGSDPRMPERIEFLGEINGVSQLVDRDGCRYARVVPR